MQQWIKLREITNVCVFNNHKMDSVIIFTWKNINYHDYYCNLYSHIIGQNYK